MIPYYGSTSTTTNPLRKPANPWQGATSPSQPTGQQFPSMTQPMGGSSTQPLGGMGQTQPTQPWSPMTQGLPGNAPMVQGGMPSMGSQSLPGAPQQPGGGFSAPYGTTNNLDPYSSGWGGKPYEYQAPGAFNVESDPGFQFAKQEAMNALLNSASARGALGSTGTQNDILDRVTGLGWQHANDAYGRYADQRNFGRSNFESDRGAGMQDTADAFGRFGQDRNFASDNYWKGYDRNYGAYRDQVGDYNTRQQQQFNQMSGLSGQQMAMSELLSKLGLGYGQNISDLMTGEGAIRANGRLGVYDAGKNFWDSLLTQGIRAGSAAYGAGG